MKGKVGIRSFIIFYLLIFSLFLIGTFAGNYAVTAISEVTPLPNRWCIVIDAGHGGVDGGATSCTGILESAINLDISMRLNDLFHLLGYETLMIRNSDISVYTEGESIAAKKMSDLKQRVKLVNETEKALLISIHQNHFSDSRYYGAQVFYAKGTESETLAKKLQSSLVTSLNPGSKRMTKKANGVYIMEHILCPGVLIECGFLSNPTEEAKLRDKEYQKLLCCVIAATITQYIDA